MKEDCKTRLRPRSTARDTSAHISPSVYRVLYCTVSAVLCYCNNVLRWQWSGSAGSDRRKIICWFWCNIRGLIYKQLFVINGQLQKQALYNITYLENNDYLFYNVKCNLANLVFTFLSSSDDREMICRWMQRNSSMGWSSLSSFWSALGSD